MLDSSSMDNRDASGSYSTVVLATLPSPHMNKQDWPSHSRGRGTQLLWDLHKASRKRYKRSVTMARWAVADAFNARTWEAEAS